MLRSAFRATMRQPITRGLATARPMARSSRTPRVALATSVFVASAVLFPWASVGNDADKAKVSDDKKKAQKEVKETVKKEQAAEPTKAAPEVEGGETGEEGVNSEEGNGESQAAAFNPETGEINWDCPCLGGMAHGPCGDEFKAAFSCFIYSETEPKGIDCIEKFEAMRTCFKQHPEHYKEELYEDEPSESTPEVAQPEKAGKSEQPVEEVATEDIPKVA